MIQNTATLKIKTPGQGIFNITRNVEIAVDESRIRNGLVNICILHTSASLIIQENASEEVLTDMLNFFNKFVPMDNTYRHSLEGRDDMPAHIKSALTCTHICLSVIKSSLILGRWQGIFLFEHRLLPHQREILVHSIGG